MKVLFVIDTYETNNNGTSISAQRYAEELRRCGHEVKILCADEQPAEDKFLLPEKHHRPFDGLVHKHGFRFAKVDEKIIRQAVEWSDIVHCFMPFYITIAAKRIADELGKPATAAFHIQPENITSSIGMGKLQWLNEMFYRNFRKVVYRHFTHIHVPSQFMAREIQQRGYNAKIHVISNGIQPEFHYVKAEKSAEYEGKILITMVGRLSQEKRQDVIINAMKYSKYADQIQLVFAGRGPEYERYVELGKQLRNQPQFVYLKKAELIKLLAQTDLYVHASDMESEAISCIEAFATSLVPIIANSEVSATPQFALDGRSLFLPGNPKDLARAIDYWIEHPEEKAQMEEEYAEFAKNYSLEKSVAEFEKMLQEAVDEYETMIA
jgi:glycosyltransferase involved in cell wall biosynthesis